MITEKKKSFALVFFILILGSIVFSTNVMAKGEKCWISLGGEEWDQSTEKVYTATQCKKIGSTIWASTQPSGSRTIKFGDQTYTLKSPTSGGGPDAWVDSNGNLLHSEQQTLLNDLYYKALEEQQKPSVEVKYDAQAHIGKAYKQLAAAPSVTGTPGHDLQFVNGKFDDAGEDKGCAKKIGNGLIVCNCDSCPNNKPEGSVFSVKNPATPTLVGTGYTEKTEDHPELYTPVGFTNEDIGAPSDNAVTSVGFDPETGDRYCQKGTKFYECGYIVNKDAGVFFDDSKEGAFKSEYRFGCSNGNCKTINANQFFTGPSGTHYALVKDGAQEDSSSCQALDQGFKDKDYSAGYCWTAFVSQAIQQYLSVDQYKAFGMLYDNEEGAKRYNEWLQHDAPLLGSLISPEIAGSYMCSMGLDIAGGDTGDTLLSPNTDGWMNVAAEVSVFKPVVQNELGAPEEKAMYVNKIAFGVVASQQDCTDNLTFNVFYGVKEEDINLGEFTTLKDSANKNIPLYRGKKTNSKKDKTIAPGSSEIYAGQATYVTTTKNNYAGTYVCIEVQANNQCFDTDVAHPALCNKITSLTAASLPSGYDCPKAGGQCQIVELDADDVSTTVSDGGDTTADDDPTGLFVHCLDCN